MATVNGVVEAMSHNPAYGTHGILVDGTWYNSKYEIKCSKGDEVEFDNGGKKYVNKLKVVGSGSSPTAAAGGKPRTASPARGYSRGVFPIPKDDGQRSIIRQNSVTNAVTLLSECATVESMSKDDMVAAVIDIARIFESYSAGDLDREAAEELDKAFRPE